MSNEIIEGTVIHGTHRMQDVLPALLDELRRVAPTYYAALVSSPFPPIPAYADDDKDSEWWDSEDAIYLLVNLMDDLSDFAPEGYCFGTHPADGSDYGWWPVDDEDDEGGAQ